MQPEVHGNGVQRVAKVCIRIHRRADYTTHTHLRFLYTPSYIALHRIRGTQSWVLLCVNTSCGEDMVLPACPCCVHLRFESPIAGHACVWCIWLPRECAGRHAADCPAYLHVGACRPTCARDPLLGSVPVLLAMLGLEQPSCYSYTVSIWHYAGR